MSYKRMTLNFTPEEMSVLREAARRDFRQPRDHAKYLLLTALGQIPRGPDEEKRNAAGGSLATTPAAKAAT